MISFNVVFQCTTGETPRPASICLRDFPGCPVTARIDDGFLFITLNLNFVFVKIRGGAAKAGQKIVHKQTPPCKCSAPFTVPRPRLSKIPCVASPCSKNVWLHGHAVSHTLHAHITTRIRFWWLCQWIFRVTIIRSPMRLGGNWAWLESWHLAGNRSSFHSKNKTGALLPFCQAWGPPVAMPIHKMYCVTDLLREVVRAPSLMPDRTRWEWVDCVARPMPKGQSKKSSNLSLIR